MKYDLKTPCKNCPFRTDKTAIRFAGRERAEEIEEQGYRRGFPCHKSATLIDDEDTLDGESGGYTESENSQHCVGYIIMQLKAGFGTPWPGINNDDELLEKLERQVNWDAPVFDSEEAFFAANESPRINASLTVSSDKDCTA